MARIEYTEEQITEFIETAQELGIGPACRELGYPKSYNTARKWLDQRGIEVTVDSLASAAQNMRWFYEERELLEGAQLAYLRIYEALQMNDLEPDEYDKLTKSLDRVAKTILLLKGKATDRRETIANDGADAALQEMLNEVKAQQANSRSA